MRKKDSVEKDFDDLSDQDKVIAAALGRSGLKAWNNGMLEIALWVQAMAECRKRHPGMPELERKKLVTPLFGDYEEQMREVLLDPDTLRLLADALELMANMPHDRLRLELLSMKLASGPLTAAGDKVDAGVKPLTAKELAKRMGVSIKHVRLLAKRLNVKLTPAQKGRPLGTGKKIVHRASRNW